MHGVCWKDELEWMEPMKGERWERFLHNEQKRWAKELDKVSGNIPLLRNEIIAAKKVRETPLFGSDSPVRIAHHGTMNISWNWIEEITPGRTAVDLDWCRKYPDRVWVIEEAEDSEGAEIYILRCYKKGQEKPLWQVRGVGPYVSIVGDRCWLLEAKNSLVYWRLISFLCETGKDKQIHYEEKDFRYNLELIRGSCSCSYVRRQSGAKEDLFCIHESGNIELLEGISLDSRRFIIGGQGYFVWEAGIWKARGIPFQLPDFSRNVPEKLDLEKKLLVTCWKGERTLWKLSSSSSKPPILLWKGIGMVMLDLWGGDWVRFTQPGTQAVWWNVKEMLPPHSMPCWTHTVRRLESPSGVPFVIVQPHEKSVRGGLFVIGYGAYGIPTPLDTSRWQPLLHRGWTLVIGLWRGGGDWTPEWTDEGRLGGREQVLKDAEEVVRFSQKSTGYRPEKTVLYGRSAGGLWVGGLISRYGKELAGGAYMEVPYLDVLKTTSNRSLPLTEIETDEFGLPEQRLSDFLGMMHWSPMEQLCAKKPRQMPWQIVRTGLNDKQVFAYESAKWVMRSGEKALLAVEGGQGHFVSGSVALDQMAEDLAILLQKI